MPSDNLPPTPCDTHRLVFPSLPLHIDDVHKLGLQRCTTHEEPIDVQLRRYSNPGELNTRITRVGMHAQSSLAFIAVTEPP